MKNGGSNNVLKLESQKIIEKLAKEFGVKVAIVFGSVARGKEKGKSDIDLAIFADKKFYEEKFSDFIYELMEAEAIEQREIDVVPISGENPILLYNIFNDGIPVYVKNEEEYLNLRSWARFVYEDSRRFFFGREESLKKRLEKLKV